MEGTKRGKKYNSFLKYATVIIITAIVVLFFKSPQKVETPSKKEYVNINKDGSFVVKGRNKEVTVAKDFTKSTSKNLKQFEWYTDVYCPDCTRAHNASKEYIDETIKDGKLEIKFHILNFLPHVTDSNDYSLETASWLIAIAEKYPNKILDAMNLLYNDEFKDKFKESKLLNEDILEYLTSKTKFLSEKEAKYIYDNIEDFENTVNRGSVGIRRDKNLKELSPDKEQRVFVPFIYNIEDKKVLDGENEDAETHILKPLKGLSGCGEDC